MISCAEATNVLYSINMLFSLSNLFFLESQCGDKDKLRRQTLP